MPHIHEHEESDRWTKLSAFGELCNHLVTNPYFLAQVFDSYVGAEPVYLGLSKKGSLFGGAFGFSAFGAAYCHFKLNHHNQVRRTTPPLSIRALDITEEELDHSNTYTLESPVNTNRKPLEKWQLFMLFGDALAHICEVAAPISFAYDLATHNLNFPSWFRTTWQTGAFVAGALGAVAPVRTCKNSIQGIHSEKINQGDIWTTLNAGIDAIANVISNSAWASQLLGAIIAFFDESQSDPIDGLDFTRWEIWACLGTGLATGIISAYLHFLVNKHHEDSSTQMNEPVNHTMLYEADFDSTKGSHSKIKRALARAADLYTHAADKASSFSFIATLATRNYPLSKTANLSIQLGSLVFGLFTGYADNRTCLRAYDKETELEKLLNSNNKTPKKSAPEHRVSMYAPKKKPTIVIKKPASVLEGDPFKQPLLDETDKETSDTLTEDTLTGNYVPPTHSINS